VNASLFISGFSRNAPIPGPAFPTGWSAAAEIAARGTIPGDLNYRNTRHTSGYVMLEYDITSQIEASAEVRYGKEKFSYLSDVPSRPGSRRRVRCCRRRCRA